MWAGLFNMVFSVLPPWGPWSDNVVPLVRLSRCLIRTANGAPPPSAHLSPTASVPASSPALGPKEQTGLSSIAPTSLDPESEGQEQRDWRDGVPSPTPGPRSAARGAGRLGDTTPPGRRVPHPVAETTRGAQTGVAPLPAPRRPSPSCQLCALRGFLHFLAEILGDRLASPGQVPVRPLQRVTDEVCSLRESRWRPGHPRLPCPP